MKDRIFGTSMPIPEALVNIKGITGLHVLEHTQDESTVGAAITLTEIASDKTLSRRHAALSLAAEAAGTNQIRNVGTLGGNLCQRPRCWYFRHPAFDCYKKGGEQCYAIAGRHSTYFGVYEPGVCVMAHPSDLAPALVALDATANIAGSSGTRRVPMAEFYVGPRDRQDHVVKDDEILVSVTIPMSGKRSVFLKYTIRDNWDFGLVSVAAAAIPHGSSLRSVGVVLGGVAVRPYVLHGTGALLADGLTPRVRKDIRRQLASESRPLRNNRYKVRIATAMVLRALDSLTTQREN
jgi:xanthine dehydrogenase YagS FAD-binding subunit